MRKYNLLTISDCEDESLIAADTVDDLNLRVIFDDEVINILTKRASEETIKARQEVFKQLDNVECLDTLKHLSDLISDFFKAKELFQQADNQYAQAILFGRYAGAYFRVSDMECCMNGLFFQRYYDAFKNVRDSKHIWKPLLDEYCGLCGIISSFSLRINGNSCQLFRKVSNYSYNDALFNVIANIRNVHYNAHSTGNTLSIKLSATMGDEIALVFSEEIKRCEAIKRELISYIDDSIIEAKKDILFYLKMQALKRDALEKGCCCCLPSLSKNAMFVAEAVYDVSQLKLIDHIIPNNVNLYEHKTFFVLGANGGGKTTYLRAAAINLLLGLSGCVMFAKNATIGLYTHIWTLFARNEKIDHGGRLVDETTRVNDILNAATENSIVFLNEIFSSTSSERGTNLALETIKKARSKGVSCLFVTHFWGVIDSDIPTLFAVVSSEGNRRTFLISENKKCFSSFANDILVKYGIDKLSLDSR